MLVVFEVQSDKPLAITGEVACHLEWTHVSASAGRGSSCPKGTPGVLRKLSVLQCRVVPTCLDANMD